MKNYREIFFILFYTLLLLANDASTQDMQRTKQTVTDLCSPKMYGRGYLANGDKIAAKYIANRLEKAGAKKFNDSYFQNFSLNINTFPDKVQLEIDGKKLDLGADFIVSPISTSGSGSGQAYFLDSLIFTENVEVRQTFLKEDLTNRIIIFNGKDYPKIADLPTSLVRKFYQAKAFISIENKLTMSLANTQLSKPTFSVLQSKLPSKAKKIKFALEAKLVENYTTQNVIGYWEGTAKPDSFIVFTAHYDHLGGLGKKIYFAGANDNASGITLLLELLEYYKQNRPTYSVAFLFFGAEEAGLLGSKFYTENPLFPLSQIKFLINLDLVGTGIEGITVVNATVFPKEFSMLEQINQEKNLFSQVRKRGKAANSDHYFFTEKGVKSFFIYTLGGIQAYHDIYDKAETLPLSHYENLFQLLTVFVERFAFK
ncbi:MAG: M28 family peptidase [Thermoflexibacter sp.]